MSRRLLALILRAAPTGFRRRYGPELLRVHDGRRSERRGLARLAFDVREVCGMAVLVLRLRLGGRTEAAGAGRRRTMFDALGQDGRFAVRSLRKNPGFTIMAVSVLALGIGGTTAIFSAVNAYFFQPLPFADETRLVMIYETNPEFGWSDATAAPANALDWREQVGAIDDLALYSEFVARTTHVREGEPTLLRFANVTGNFFDVLGVRPLLGRGFRWEETWEGDDAVVVLSHALWTSMFGREAGVVGRTMAFGGRTVEIVGVMPEGFAFPGDEVQLWTTWGWDPANREAVWFRRAHWVRPVARLAPGVTVQEAEAELQVVVRRLQQDYPETNRAMGAGLMPLRDFLIKDIRGPLLLLLGAVGLLLVMACTNVANLMLVRAGERGREVAVRRALGAGSGRVAGLVLAEALVVSALGGLLGLGLGWVGVRGFTGLADLGIEGATAVSLDHRVVLFTAGTSILAALAFALAPIVRNARGGRFGSLAGGERGGAEPGALRMARGLVGAEVALALLLVVGAGLMVRSFWFLREVDPGFEIDGVLAVTFDVPSSRYEARDDVLAFYDRLLAALEARPGIERAGTVGQLPLSGTSWSSRFQAEGWPPERVGFEILHRRADPGYFEALQIPLIRGRLLQDTDGPDDPRVVVINETFAHEHFPNEDPVGQRIAYDRAADENSTWREIVGIVGDQSQVSPREPPRAEVFESRHQDWGRENWVVVRTDGEALGALTTVRETLRELDPLIPIAQARPLHDVWRTSMAREELILSLLTAFGALALVLAAVGVYGVTAQVARKRTREIGVRMALGADRRHVVRLLLRQGLGTVGVGLVLGLAMALAASRVMASVLYQVQPGDPATLAGVAALLGLVAAVACYVPARRATRVDPVQSLRVE